MSGTIVERGALSVLDRGSWFIDGLDDWRLSAIDTGNVASFDELKEYMLAKATAARMNEVYEKEEAAREAAEMTIRGSIKGATMEGLTRETQDSTSIWS
jgi:hypothetical protein